MEVGSGLAFVRFAIRVKDYGCTCSDCLDRAYLFCSRVHFCRPFAYLHTRHGCERVFRNLLFVFWNDQSSLRLSTDAVTCSCDKRHTTTRIISSIISHGDIWHFNIFMPPNVLRMRDEADPSDSFDGEMDDPTEQLDRPA